MGNESAKPEAGLEGSVRDGFRDDPDSDRGGVAEETDTEADSATPPLSRSEFLTALFWILLGLLTIAIVLPFAGFDLELLAPGFILVGYGLFVLWKPEVATSDAPWTGVLWIVLGVFTLVFLQVVELYWAYEVTGILIGFFLVFAGLLTILDL